ncbi:glycosyltransferase family 4 protein [Alcanivorax sp. MM125-6]|nr:glycosyltransferase family 4 protein [Alcanivorax sp. MM125-6]
MRKSRFFIIHDKVFSKLKGGAGLCTEIGGVQRYLYELAKIINELGNEVFVIQDDQDDAFFLYENIKVWCTSFNVGKRRVFSRFASKFSFDKEVDVVIWGSDTISIPLPGVRTIAIQHGIGFDLITPDSFFKKTFVKLGCVGLYRWLQRYNSLHHFKNSTFKVCVDYNYLNWYRTFSKDDENVFVIPNFCTYEVSPYEKESKSDIVIGFARRFVEKRGVRLFVQAARKILEERSNIKFLIAGDGPLNAEVDRLAMEYSGKVKRTKFSQSETQDFHRAVDIAVVPSLGSEGTSLSLIEAMGAGCAVIATNIGGMTNIVIDQFNGYLIPPREEALILAIEKISDDYNFRSTLGQNAIATVDSGFSYRLWKKKWLDVISYVCERS